MYKKVYLEITNICNLHCPFCIGNKRKQKFMAIEEFRVILNKLEKHTKYLYFHVLGEPLMHPQINEFIAEGSKKYKINVTTNGYFIDRIKNNKNIRQINISLHSFADDGSKTLEDYLKDILMAVDVLKKYTYISYRIWQKTKYKEEIINYLEKYYDKKIDGHMQLDENVFIEMENIFEWPDLDNDVFKEKGTCYALKDHIAILVDGTVVPCCLDTLGIIKLGNIFVEEIEGIILSDRYQKMLLGFRENKKVESLCQHCDFIK